MISISLIDYIGIMPSEEGDGVAVLLSLVIKENTYELVYWFNPDNKFRIVMEDKFYQNFLHILRQMPLDHSFEPFLSGSFLFAPDNPSTSLQKSDVRLVLSCAYII